MTSKILRSTVRGQITLPKEWRMHFDTDNYVAEMHEAKLVITPIHLDQIARDDILFDADRDNRGKGVSPEAMIRALKRIRHG